MRNIVVIIIGLVLTSVLPMLGINGVDDPLTKGFAAQLLGLLLINLAILFQGD